MYSDNPISHRRRFKNGVMAALEIGAEKRAEESGFETLAPDARDRRYAIARTAAIVEADAKRIGASDVTALEAVCASQVLALDVIFNQYAREAAQWKTLSSTPMAMALKAQSQCRATLKTLLSLARKKKSRNFDEQTIANGNCGA
jgi:hypothetical protein